MGCESWDAPQARARLLRMLMRLWMLLWISVSPLWADWTADLGHCRVAARCVPHRVGEVGLRTTSYGSAGPHGICRKLKFLSVLHTSYHMALEDSEYKEWVIWTTFIVLFCPIATHFHYTEKISQKTLKKKKKLMFWYRYEMTWNNNNNNFMDLDVFEVDYAKLN